MSALEIVLVAVASFLLFIILLYVTVAVYVKKAAVNKAEDFHIMDEFRLNHDVVFLGDSLTDFYPIEEFTDVKIVNRGIAGDTTSDVMHRVSEVVELKPKKLFLQIGINDMIRKGARTLTAQALAERIFAVVNKFDKTETEINVISLYPVNRRKILFSTLFTGKATNKRIKEVNKILKEKCDSEQLNFINLYDCLSDEKGNLKKEFTVEGLHITVKGYAAISKVLMPFVTENK